MYLVCGPSADMMLAPFSKDLRAQLSAVINHAPGPHGYNDISHHSSSASPHDHNIDPAIGGPGGIMSTGGKNRSDENGFLYASAQRDERSVRRVAKGKDRTPVYAKMATNG